MEVIRDGDYWVGRVSTEYGVRHFTGFGAEYKAWKRGQIYEELANRYDLSDESRRGELPVNVAIDGKEAIAAYLYAVHERSREDIADTLNVRRDTVDQYLSNVRSDQPSRSFHSLAVFL